jgi:leucyl/phenylalanyl-tRNA--protein transferase
MPVEGSSDPNAGASQSAQTVTSEMLLWAYCRGIFPMADPDRGEIGWYSPDPRGILPLDAFHVPRTLARAVRRARFEIRCDSAFERVMRACAAPRRDEHLSWIDERLIRAYVGLHERGGAHSIEAWREGQLVGGLYGVQLNAAFFGESMFIRPGEGGTDASKICLVHLVAHLRRRGFGLLDTQFTNEHLEQFGCIEIPREAYMDRLEAALMRPLEWGAFEPDPARDARVAVEGPEAVA